MTNIREIVQTYKDLCSIYDKKISRDEYRKANTGYSSGFIEKIWGSWSNFTEEAEKSLLVNRTDIIKTLKNKKVVITYIPDGADVNLECFYTLENYCDRNKADLVILWGKNVKRNKLFDSSTFNLLRPYLATEVIFEKDKKCLVKDFLIPNTQKNPLVNLDRLTTGYTTAIVGSCKQYMKILPYKQYEDYRIAYSTGTISDVEYKTTVSGALDEKNHTLGAVLLDYDNTAQRYISRNLIFKEGFIYDLNKKYDKENEYKEDNIASMVLGDLHLPEESPSALMDSLDMINKYKPQYVFIHDVASWNSISHHEFNLPFTRAKNRNDLNQDLETELNIVEERLNIISEKCPKTTFCIISSNHDEFVRKYLEKDFNKDTPNARLAAQLFIKYLDGETILTDVLPENFIQLEKNTSCKINGFEVNEHGDCGIAGAKGSVRSFNRGFDSLIHGHTHSPEIYEKVVVVGTLSKLKLNYNQQGLTNWAHCNCIIHHNGSFQLIFLPQY